MAQIIDMKQKTIKDFFNQDIVTLKDFPDEDVSNKFYKVKIDFGAIENETSRQQFRDLLAFIFYSSTPYHKTSNRLYQIFRLAGFMSNLNGIIQIPDGDLQTMFNKYCDKKKYSADCKKIILTCKNNLLELYDTRNGFDRDTWDKSVFTLSDERINKSLSDYSFHFRLIENVDNRELVKIYIKYLLGNTELAFSTIINIFSNLNKFCAYLGSKSLLVVTKQDIYDYLDENKGLSQDAYNHLISRTKGLYDYLAIKKLFTSPIPFEKIMYRTDNVEPTENLVDEYVILQIFNHLHKAPFAYMLMYLINYCTGMRISDVCQLRTDCLYYDGKDGYYIRPYNCQKMQKPIMNLIPQALYKLIQEQIKIINNLDYGEYYLFPSEEEKLRPYQSQTFRNNFKALCLEWGIKNSDGSDYNYRSHSYRHTISSDLYINYKVPAVTIQKAVLWHKEIQMSLHYIERTQDLRKMKADKYFSRTGEAELSSWVKDNLRNLILPNGICGKATKLGICPNVDACLSCEHFRTSRKFLQVHKDQLATIKSRLKIYEANNWKPNIETAHRQIKELETIIKKLEEMEESDDSTTIKASTTSSNI